MKLELNETEMNQLMAFLNRTQLQGGEAVVFLQLIQKIQRQIQTQQMMGPAPQLGTNPRRVKKKNGK